jgi:hypothetical protein
MQATARLDWKVSRTNLCSVESAHALITYDRSKKSATQGLHAATLDLGRLGRVEAGSMPTNPTHPNHCIHRLTQVGRLCPSRKGIGLLYQISLNDEFQPTQR